MAIILAIEPDRKQAAHLSAVVRHRVGAELILADTTEGALDAIGSRVPDLVLVPALLSPQDDAALAAALRVIAVAAHVRTLTTPVFSNGTKGSQGGGGLFSRFLGGKAESTSVGCDPAVFAEQISDYLREAAEERADREADSDFNQPFAEEPVVAAPPAPEPAPIVRERELFASFNPTRTREPEPEPEIVAQFAEPEPEPEPQPVYVPPPGPAADPEAFAFVDAANEIFARPERRSEPIVDDEDSDDVIVIDLSDDIVEMSPETVHAESSTGDELFDGEPFGVYTLSLDEKLDTPLEAAPVAKIDARKAPAAPVVETPVAPVAEPIVADARPVERKPLDLDRIWLGLRHTPQWPVLEGVAVESVTLNDFVAAPLDKLSPKGDRASMPPPVVTPQAGHRAEHLDWATLVASLRQDIEHRRHQPRAAAPAAAAPRPTQPPRQITNPAAPSSLRRASQGGPAQDEWGFFDPQQCGFAALLAKLDEFSDGPDDPKSHKAS